MRDHYVYWVRDDQGVLLYIGCTKYPTARYEQHMSGDNRPLGWFNQVPTSWRFRGPLPGAVALTLEAAEIAEHRPIFNVRGVPGRLGRQIDGVVGPYFASRGIAWPYDFSTANVA